MKKHMKGTDGKYHIKGKTFDMLIGSRAQVWHGTSYKTSGDLTKNNLFMNKHGRIVSRKKHETAKKEKRLEKHGFFAKKGKFGSIHKTVKNAGKGKKGKSRKR
jgi:hypothetical protein